MADKKVIASWILAVLGALMFFGAGGGKLAQVDAVMEGMEGTLGLPVWFILVVGAIEVAGAILLLVPKTRFYGAAGLTLTMVGAIATHAVKADWAGMGAPIVPGVIVAIVLALHWEENPLTQ